MDHELEALSKTRLHAARARELAELAEAYLAEGRFEDAEAALRLVEKDAALGREGLGPLLSQQGRSRLSGLSYEP